MDSYALREQENKLIKSVNELSHKLEIGEKRIKELHSEEIRYLEEIPIYKKRSEDAKNNYLKLESQSLILKKELENIINELNNAKDSVTEEQIRLENYRKEIFNHGKEISDCNVNINRRIAAINTRELSVQIRENDCLSREEFNKKVESDLDNREVDLKIKENKLNDGIKLLDSWKIEALEIEKINKETSLSIIEQRKFLEEDKQLIRDKLSKAEKLVKDHCDLKAQLLLQADKMSKSIKLADDKQIMLDRALADLSNQENNLKIKDLRIRKMAHDIGLQKELKELEASLK